MDDSGEKARFVLTPVVGKYFVGRKALVRELVEELGDKGSHIGFCVYGKRRIGKTSILLKAQELLSKKKDIVVAYLSLYDVPNLSPDVFAEELISAVVSQYQSRGLLPMKMHVKELLKAPLAVALELLKSIKLEASIVEQIKLVFEYKEGGGSRSEYIRQAFGIGEALADATSTKCIIILDEFPEIVRFENGLQLVKMLRTQYERQKMTSLVISGSIRKTLDIVALSDTSPLYKQLVPKHLPPFTKEEVVEFLGLYRSDVDPNAVDKLYEITGGSPFYLQFIGRSTKYSGSIEEIVKTFIDQEGDLFFREEFDKLSTKQKGIVAELASGKKSLSAIAESMNELPTTIGSYLPSLMETETLTKESRGTYALADNMFGYWLRTKVKAV